MTSFARGRPRPLPSPLWEEANWQSRGRCQGYPAAVFFPEDDHRQLRRRREEEAKQICRGCPVLARCQEHALKTPEVYGVWGCDDGSGTNQGTIGPPSPYQPGRPRGSRPMTWVWDLRATAAGTA